MSRKRGARGEDQAVAFLQQRGYRVLERNFQRPFGEIDVIAEDQGVLCFVEVRMRQDATHGHPLETVTSHKRRRIVRAAEAYLQHTGRADADCRFDVVAIVGDHVELVRGAFDAGFDD